MIDLERHLREADVIQYSRFVTAGGQPAEVKVELECLDPYSEAYNQNLFALVLGAMALKAIELSPDYLISAPHGADGLTAALSEELEIPFVIPEKDIGSKEILAPKAHPTFGLIPERHRGVIIDDVLTSGSTLKRIESLSVFRGRVIAGLVVWDRFPHINRHIPFETFALIESHVPLMKERV